MTAAPHSASGANEKTATVGEGSPIAEQILAALKKIIVAVHRRPGDAIAATGYTALGAYALLLLGRVIVG